MGGITYNGGCVVSRINGGYRNGGYTLRLHGRRDPPRRQAGARARAHAQERLQPAENDLTRARRQQKILVAMKRRLLSPSTFLRLPLDRVGGAEVDPLGHGRPDAARPVRQHRDQRRTRTPCVLPGVAGGNGLTVPDAVKQREVRPVP